MFYIRTFFLLYLFLCFSPLLNATDRAYVENEDLVFQDGFIYLNVGTDIWVRMDRILEDEIGFYIYTDDLSSMEDCDIDMIEYEVYWRCPSCLHFFEENNRYHEECF